MHLDIELCMKRVPDDNETTAYDTVFSGIISRFDPNIISLIPSPSHLKQSSSLFQFMSRELTGLPTVILAIEKGKTDELISLLKLGVADFVTARLESIDVLPRIWQLLKHKRCDATVKRIVQGGLP